MRSRAVILLLVLSGSLISHAQGLSVKDTAAINALINQSKSLVGTDSAKAIQLALEALKKSKEANYTVGEGLALKYAGMVYYIRGYFLETLDYWNKSLEVSEKTGDNDGMANMLNNISAVYFNQGADAKALEYSLKSLQIAEKINDTLRMISALINVGSTYYNKKDPVALGYLLKVLPMAESTGNWDEYVVVTGNIGEIYYDQKDDIKAVQYYQKSIDAAGDDFSSAFSINGLGKVYARKQQYNRALEYHNKALKIANKFGDNLQVTRSLRGIASVDTAQGKIIEAIAHLNEAKKIAEEMDDANVELSNLYKEMAFAYAKNRNYEQAFQFKTLYSDLKDTLYDIESKKKLNQLQFDFELSKKESELVIKEEKIKSEKQARMGITVTLCLLLIGSTIIYRNYLQKVKTNRILDKQKDEIETLLLNILPKEIAIELRNNGTSLPRHIDEVSVLFTDFVGFTNIADEMKPNDLLSELNECFMAFDNIVEKYGLEKIKTIGDAYMCASNLPSHLPDHEYKIIKAALEMQAFLKEWNAKRAESGKVTWEIRMGVHTGPVVAGVVGRKKYAYDIWGSTVNIASRMETNGAPGKVNISAFAYERLKERFDCVYRGKIIAKNLGELDMYYIEGEKPNGEILIPKTTTVL